MYLLHVFEVGLSHHYFCTYNKTPSAPACGHAERNPFVHLLKGGGGLTSEGEGLPASQGRKMRSRDAQVARGGDGAGAAARKERRLECGGA